MSTSPAEILARKFHEIYERMAPDFGYRTRPETRHFDPYAPQGRLMVAVCSIMYDSIREMADPYSFQERVGSWTDACFGPNVARDPHERRCRFLEEALEVAQAAGMPPDHAHSLVDYVYGRDTGELKQEVGGAMLTLAALCRAADINMYSCGEIELDRVWQKIEQIRAKQAAKAAARPKDALP